MEIALSKAKARLSELAARADSGEEVVVTRRGKNSIRLVADQRKPTPDEKWRLLQDLLGSAKGKPGMEGVTSQNITDFLYDGNGLPA